MATMPRAPDGPRSGRLLLAAFCIGWTALLVLLSGPLSFRDNGDFMRVVGGMLVFPTPIPLPGTMSWTFRAGGSVPIEHFELAAYVFRLLGTLVAATGLTEFDLAFSALVGKLLVALGLFALSDAFARRNGTGRRGQALVFALLMLVAFQAHNAGLLTSFYAEYVCFLALPVLLYGLVDWPSKKAVLFMCAGATGIGLAKVQYFYVPLLALFVMWLLHWRQGRSVREPALVALSALLLVGQAVCLLPMRHNIYQQVNYYHSTYFGSYMALTETQRAAIGLTPAQIACIGVDAWGSKAMGAGGSEPVRVTTPCFGHMGVLQLKDVLRPYLAFPSAAWALARFALPVHFTTQYFHVYRDQVFLVPSHGSFGVGEILVDASRWRDRILAGPFSILVLALGCILPLARTRSSRILGPTMLFLSLFVVSQLVISFLGEGIRDLSKHLWAAQLALDFLALALVGQALLWASDRRRALPAPPVRGTHSASAS